MRMRRQRQQPSSLEALFERFPRGIALLELTDPSDTLRWRLAAINELASNLVVPSIETFVSAAQLRLGGAVDLPKLYRAVLIDKKVRTIGIIEAKNFDATHQRLYTMLAFPAGERSVGILFEDFRSLSEARIARAKAEKRLAQTCEFVGAIVWKAKPETLQFTYASPQAQTILGYWPERWTGETNFWSKHLFPEDRELVARACERILRGRKRQHFEFRMISAHGHVLWFHAAAEVAEIPGGPLELVGVMNDITELKQAEERIRGLSSRLMRLQDDERRHISRELHDSLGQYLTSIKINLEIVKREGAQLSEQHRGLLTESSETLERCVQEVRSVSYLLHPPLLEELGLLAALRWYTAGFAERSGVEISLNVPREFSRLPSEMELAFFRIVQESLTNVQRHSQSETARVTLSEHRDRAEIRVADSGVGISAETLERITEGKTIEGAGLRGMYERVRELGGQLAIESTRMGTVVSAVLPLEFREEEEKVRAEKSEERKSRAAGKRLESADLRIEDPSRAAAAKRPLARRRRQT